MVLVAIFSETGFFDYCAVKVNDTLTMLVHKSKNQYKCSRLRVKFRTEKETWGLSAV